MGQAESSNEDSTPAQSADNRKSLAASSASRSFGRVPTVPFTPATFTAWNDADFEPEEELGSFMVVDRDLSLMQIDIPPRSMYKVIDSSFERLRFSCSALTRLVHNSRTPSQPCRFAPQIVVHTFATPHRTASLPLFICKRMPSISWIAASSTQPTPLPPRVLPPAPPQLLPAQPLRLRRPKIGQFETKWCIRFR
jgi:hypothetical protein